MEETVINPGLPYFGHTTGKFSPGKIIRIQGTILDTSEIFDITLHCQSRAVIAMQISVHLVKGYISVNSCENGTWGEEQKGGTLPIRGAGEFEITLTCEFNQYKVAVNGLHYCTFPQRIHYNRISHLAIEGDVSIVQISYRNGFSGSSPSTVGFSPSPYEALENQKIPAQPNPHSETAEPNGLPVEVTPQPSQIPTDPYAKRDNLSHPLGSQQYNASNPPPPCPVDAPCPTETAYPKISQPFLTGGVGSAVLVPPTIGFDPPPIGFSAVSHEVSIPLESVPYPRSQKPPYPKGALSEGPSYPSRRSSELDNHSVAPLLDEHPSSTVSLDEQCLCIEPKRLYSPHTMFLRQSGHCFEIATGLCSLLLGLGYDAFVVSGFATEDVCKRIMKRVECPFPPEKEEEVVEVKREIDPKYVLKPPTDLRSKFLLAMEQRELDKIKAEKQRIADEERKKQEEEERPPDDDLYGARRHSWVLLLAGEKDVETSIFIEASTGVAYSLDHPFYLGIDSLWNNNNYWVNLQDCSQGLSNLDYDFSNLNNWEHLLMGEPTKWRDRKISEEMEDDEVELLKLMEEKHLDMPTPWSLRISIPHEVLKNRFPGGTKITHYLRTMVHQYAPYVQPDGLVLKICRHTDMECHADELQTIEERYANRMQNMQKVIIDMKNRTITHYFRRGREDAVKLHTYYEGTECDVEAIRTLEFYHHGRHDGLQKLELGPHHLTEYYIQREDRLYYRHTTFAVRGCPPPGFVEGLRRIVVNVVEKFGRNERIPASKDIAIREYAIVEREVHLKYHYEEGKVTASTRDFIKPSIEEMGEKLKFHPHLTSGYQAEIGGKPPRHLELFLLLKQQLEDEDRSLHQIRDVEDQVSEFLKLRTIEIFQPILKVSLFDREENKQYEQGLREREQKEKETKEREVEDDIDYLAPFINRLGNPKKLSYAQAKAVIEWCREEFKIMLVNRANDIQQQFERQSHLLHERHQWYVSVQDTLMYEEEMEYYEEVNNMTFILHSLELRLSRHRDLSPYRWEALDNYLKMDPRLSILFKR